MTTTDIGNRTVMHESMKGFKCNGDPTGCTEETAVFYRALIARGGPRPLSDTSRLRVMAYLKNGDGEVLDGTTFQHLRNVEYNEFRTWCPMAELALEFVPGWTRDDFATEGLKVFLTELVQLCAACGTACSTQCSRCKRIRYCTRTCQRADRDHHKNRCEAGTPPPTGPADS